MRDYYYLINLINSPYDLTVADALHLGVSYSLGIYVFLEDPVYLEAIRHREAEIICDRHFFVDITENNIFSLEKLMFSEGLEYSAGKDTIKDVAISLKDGVVDIRYDGKIPIRVPFLFPDEHSTYVRLYSGHPDAYLDKRSAPSPQIKISNLLCWTEDLERLVNKGVINYRKNNMTAKTAGDEPNENTELHRTQRTLSALTLGLFKKSPAYRHGNKPNIKAIADLAIDHLRSHDGRAPHGLSDKTVRETISQALKANSELLDDSEN